MTRRLQTLIFLSAVAAVGCASSESASTAPPGPGSGSGTTGSDTGSSGSTPPTMPTFPTAHPRVYLTAPTQTRLKAAVAANTAPWQTFKAVVDRWMGGDDIWGFDEWNAALVANLTGETTYCTQAIATSDAQVTAAATAAAANQLPVIAGDDYLQVGPMLTDVALVYDWCYGQLTSAQKTNWIAYMNQAVTNVWSPTTASWGGNSMPWNGWATNDPNDNYYYSFLAATMYVGLATYQDNPQATNWLTQFRTTKLANQAFPDFTSDLTGGGSREGTDYGVSMRALWQMYDWWQITTGESLATLTPNTLASMLTAIHQTLPTLDRVAPTGDQPRDSTASYFDYYRQYLAELAQMFPTATAAGPGKTLNASSSVPAMTEEFMAVYDFLYDDSDVTAAPLANLDTAYYASGIGQLYARSGWGVHDTWVNLTGGPYTESHAHQDQGAIMLYKDGWLATDAVIWSQSGLRQETNAHGVVQISSGGTAIAQVASTQSQLVALQRGSGWLYAAVDVTAAYAGDPRIQKVQRELVFLEPDVVVVYDRIDTTAGTTATWQLPTPAQPSVSGADSTISTAGHVLAVHRTEPSTATASAYAMTDDPSGDYSTGYRLDDTAAGGTVRFLHVLSIDGAASALVDGTDSVQVQLAGGATVTCTFTNGQIGGHIEVGGVTTTLGTGIQALPETP
jgi:hypothetical protein